MRRLGVLSGQLAERDLNGGGAAGAAGIGTASGRDKSTAPIASDAAIAPPNAARIHMRRGAPDL